jgi:endoglucanase
MDWLMRMQKQNGGIYHKVSQERWIGEYLPTTDPSHRYIFEVSSAATASFAASAALAARLFSEFDIKYAETLRSSALEAWEFLEINPQSIPLGGFKNPPNVSGGEYGDSNDLDERIWAAIELYRLTGESRFLRYIEIKFKHLPRYGLQPISWRNVNSIVLSSIIKIPTNAELTDLKEEAKKRLVKQANNILKTHDRNNYKNLVKHTEYYWGSNSVGLAYAYDLIKAYELTGNGEFINAAYDQLHFVLGRNPVNRSQVTAVGSKSVMNPYHQLSELDGVEMPVPGMLVGGPNNHTHLNGEAISQYPAKNYEDEFKNYLVNEVAINYTAILAYVSGYLAFKN